MSTTPAILSNYPAAFRYRRRRNCPRPSRSMFSARTTNDWDPLGSLSRLLFGRGLPPAPLISAVRSTWSSTWHLLMRQLAPSDPTSGSYSRPASAFPSVGPMYRRQNPIPDGLHLYVAFPCPWAHRTLIVRALKNLEPFLPVSIATASTDGSWAFSQSSNPDLSHGCSTLREIYGLMKGGYDGRSTVPMLWDAHNKVVVCNESYGIIEFLNSGFVPPDVSGGPDLCPPELAEMVAEWNQVIYQSVNNGVYRCGFAQSQQAYDVAATELFGTLDKLESCLSKSRYLCGDKLTLADVCLFTTLIRFDLVYNVLFKCTKKKLLEYPVLHAYTRDIYQIPKVAETCNFEATMDGYYRILFPLNPSSIRPVMPAVCEVESLSQPHSRHCLSSDGKKLESST